MSIAITCDKCRDNISTDDELVCGDCYDELETKLDAKIADLEEEIDRLKGEIVTLQAKAEDEARA